MLRVRGVSGDEASVAQTTAFAVCGIVWEEPRTSTTEVRAIPFPGVYGIGKTIEEAKGSILRAMRIYIPECRTQRKPVQRARTVYTEIASIAG